jgi:flagellar biogenesis protein FliO
VAVPALLALAIAMPAAADTEAAVVSMGPPSPASITVAPPAHEARSLGVRNGVLGGGPLDQDAATPLASDLREVARVGGALALVVGLVLVGRRLLPVGLGSTRRPSSGPVDVVARQALGRNQHLVLLRVGPRVLLVHAGGGSMTPLTAFDDPEQVAELLAESERAGGPFTRSAGLPAPGELVIDLTRPRVATTGHGLRPRRRIP